MESQVAALVAEGRQLSRAGRQDEALACFDKALALEPQQLEALGNRGNVLGALGNFDAALKDFDHALRLVPGHPTLLYNRGNALGYLGRNAEAVEAYDQALAADANMAEVWNNRGNALRQLKRVDEALASFTKAIALRPDYAKAFYNRGYAKWVNLRQITPALADFERAFAIDPDSDNLRGDLLHLRMHLGDWRDFEAQKNLIDAGVRAGKRAVGPFAYQAISESPADLLACARIYAGARYPARPPLATRVHDHAKIRVGYLCGEFREQATSFLMAGLYEQHDKTQFEIAAFDSGWSDSSPMRRRLENAFDKFVDIAGLSDREAAETIAREEIDILVNLNGYFGEDRTGIFAQRPAPIQVNYLGFPASMGADYMDYILADATVIPENEKQFYAEQVVWLPDCYQANDDSRALAAPPARGDCGLPQKGIVFCNFNQSYKLTPVVFASWMRILKAVPDSVLWLLENNSEFAANIKNHAEAAGVAPERIIFAPMAEAGAHLARLQRADLFLDTSPYNAHTTASDSLWAGVPLLTWRGTTFPGRVGASLLGAIGLNELVAPDIKSFETLAVELAQDPARLGALKSRLRENRKTMPLFDSARFARHIESAYRTMRERAKAGLPPQSFAVKSRN